jgi:RNA-binding protein YlmH
MQSSLGVDVSPLLEQLLDDLVVADTRGCLQRIAVLSSLRVDVVANSGSLMSNDSSAAAITHS